MVAGSNSDTGVGRAGVKSGVLIAAAIVLLLFLGGLTWRYFGPGAAAGNAHRLTAQQRADQDWLKQKARESGGDFNKLSTEDQSRLTSLYGKMAAYVLRGNATPAKTDY